MAQLKTSENAIIAKSPHVGEPKPSISPPMRAPVTPKPDLPRLMPGKEFVYEGRRGYLDGIIAYLTRRFGGNVHAKRVVRVTSDLSVRWPPSVADSCSSTHKDSWICYDFRKRRVMPMSYSVIQSAYWLCPT